MNLTLGLFIYLFPFYTFYDLLHASFYKVHYVLQVLDLFFIKFHLITLYKRSRKRKTHNKVNTGDGQRTRGQIFREYILISLQECTDWTVYYKFIIFVLGRVELYKRRPNEPYSSSVNTYTTSKKIIVLLQYKH